MLTTPRPIAVLAHTLGTRFTLAFYLSTPVTGSRLTVSIVSILESEDSIYLFCLYADYQGLDRMRGHQTKVVREEEPTWCWETH